MIIGVTHDQDGRVVQRLSVSTKVSIGLPEIATIPPNSTTSSSCARRSRPTGLVGEAPELKFSSQGKPIGTFSLAVNQRWKDAEGARLERVEWFSARIDAMRQINRANLIEASMFA